METTQKLQKHPPNQLHSTILYFKRQNMSPQLFSTVLYVEYFYSTNEHSSKKKIHFKNLLLRYLWLSKKRKKNVQLTPLCFLTKYLGLPVAKQNLTLVRPFSKSWLRLFVHFNCLKLLLLPAIEIALHPPTWTPSARSCSDQSFSYRCSKLKQCLCLDLPTIINDTSLLSYRHFFCKLPLLQNILAVKTKGYQCHWKFFKIWSKIRPIFSHMESLCNEEHG